MKKDSGFSKDLYRYYGVEKVSFAKKMMYPIQLKYIYYFRKAKVSGNLITKLYYRIRLKHLKTVSHIQIPIETQIGEGFFIGHYGHIVINPKAVLGKNINIAVGVTIGQTNRGDKKGCPHISDNCWIGTNAVVVGNIKIGTDVLIAPGAYVNFDVPDHSIVIGNPGRIIRREGATEGYIDYTV